MFQTTCQITEPVTVFTKHEELDTYVKNIEVACPNWQLQFAEEYTLLKAFDRAFWLRMKERTEEDEKACPFCK